MSSPFRVAVALAFVFYSATSRAEVTIYEQPSDPSGGFLSDGVVFTVADDFTPGGSAAIGAIVWWGGYGTVEYPVPERDGFTLRLYEDAAGAPGRVIATYAVGNGATRAATGRWVNPPQEPPPCAPDLPPDLCPPSPSFPGRPEYEYRFDLPAPLPLRGGERYWLSLVDVPSVDSWLWGASLAGGADVKRSQVDPVAGPWEPYTPGTAFRLIQDEGGATDADGDGVEDALDRCPGTVIPERSIPARQLGPNRFALVDGDRTFDTRRPGGRGRTAVFTIDDTHGCSCEQILAREGIRGRGLARFGCPIGVLLRGIR